MTCYLSQHSYAAQLCLLLQAEVVAKLPAYNEVCRSLSRHRTTWPTPAPDPLLIPAKLQLTMCGQVLATADTDSGERFLLHSGQDAFWFLGQRQNLRCCMKPSTWSATERSNVAQHRVPDLHHPWVLSRWRNAAVMGVAA